MSALARYFKAAGKVVAGYDRTPSGLTDQLTAEGISIHYEDSVNLIPEEFRSGNKTIIVYTPAIPADNAELLYFRANEFSIFKRAEILGFITQEKKTIAIAGTHGKTTVSTMIAYLLSNTNEGCSAFLGGISKNFKSNLVLNPGSEWVVAEADEFDRSFLQLYPYSAVITAVDPDHLDIYGTTNELNKAFNEFTTHIAPDGFLVMKKGLPLDTSKSKFAIYTYSLNEKADFMAVNIRLEHRKYYFDLQVPQGVVKDLSLMHPGIVNVENAVAAASVAILLKIEPDTIRKALSGFMGIERRFDYHINTDRMVYIDDYAHHPRELEATITSVRNLYPDKKITGVFQPHLYSRTRDLADEFAESLSLLDVVILLDIYPARELPIEGVSSEMIFKKVTSKNKTLCNKNQLLEVLAKKKIEVLLTMGAGDIDRFIEPIKLLYSET